MLRLIVLRTGRKNGILIWLCNLPALSAGACGGPVNVPSALDILMRFLGACLDQEPAPSRCGCVREQVIVCLHPLEDVRRVHCRDVQDAPIMCITEYMPGGDLERYYMVSTLHSANVLL